MIQISMYFPCLYDEFVLDIVVLMRLTIPRVECMLLLSRGKQNVIVVVNNSTSSKNQTFNFTNATVKTVQKYTASHSKNAVSDGSITASNNSFSVSLDAQSVTTLVSEGSTGVIPYRIEQYHDMLQTSGIRYQTPIMYLLNGKRSSLPGIYDLHSVSNGVYILTGKSRTSIGSDRTILNNDN